ncbi:MAG: hypothetical protein ACOX6U_03885 [Oscillospiraceae bacterium]
MLALVLILLLSHTMGALAISPKEPSVIVNSYGWLYSEIVGAQSGDVIGIRGTILIPSGAILDAGYRDIELRRMDIGAKLVFAGDPDHSIETKINSFIFNGNAPNVGGDDAFIEVNGTAVFDGCTFYDCYNGEGGIGGAMYIASGDMTIHNCDFKSCSAKYGSHIYNASSDVLQIENCTFSDGWVDEEGGAIYLSNSVGTTYIRDTTIFSNHARIGGGISNYGSLILSNSLIYQNEVTIQGADIANLGSMNNSDTAEVYDKLLSDKGLYFVGWQDDTNSSVGGSGEYLKFGVSNEKPIPPTEPEEGGNTGGTEGGDPTNPEEGGETGGTEGGEPSDPDPSNPSEGGSDTGDEGGGSTGGEDNPTGGDTEGGSGDEQDPTTPPEDTEGGDSPTEGGSGDPDPSTSSNPEQGGSGGSTDNSQTDNSTTDNSDHSTTDNSSSTVTDSSDHSTTDNSESTSSSTVDNSSRVSNTDNNSVDNSSSRSESSRTENSNNTTTYNYYTAEDEGSQAAPVATQSGSQPITVNVSVPQADQPQRAAQEPIGATGTQDQRVDQNIHIDAEGVDVIYEYTADGVSISISSNKGSESPTEAVETMAVSSSTLPSETPTEAPRGSESWVDYATLILLAVLVLGELRDKFSRKA